MNIEQIIRWFTDTDGWTFAKEMYDREWEDDVGGYVSGKFNLMQKDPIRWMASLDPQNRAKLEKLIKENK